LQVRTDPRNPSSKANPDLITNPDRNDKNPNLNPEMSLTLALTGQFANKLTRSQSVCGLVILQTSELTDSEFIKVSKKSTKILY